MCSTCTDAHRNTRLTKNHRISSVPEPVMNHPLKEEVREEGREDESYLISIYRCPTRIPDLKEPEQVHLHLSKAVQCKKLNKTKIIL